MEMSPDLKAAINQQLPAMFATEMQGFIQRAAADAAEVEHLNKRLIAESRAVTDLKAQLAAHTPIAERESAVVKREKELQATELTLLRREAALAGNLACAELQGVKETMNAFLRNVTVRQTVVADVSKPIDGAPGGNGYQGTPGMLARNYDGKPDTTTTETAQQ